MSWRRVAKSLQAFSAHTLLFCFTLLLVLKLDHPIFSSWWSVLLFICFNFDYFKNYYMDTVLLHVFRFSVHDFYFMKSKHIFFGGCQVTPCFEGRGERSYTLTFDVLQVTLRFRNWHVVKIVRDNFVTISPL